MTSESSLNNLSASEKRELLERLLERRSSSASRSYPLSYGQEALFHLYRRDPNSSAYNAALVVRLLGAVEESRLESAIVALVQRHEALRTVYDTAGGEPRQTVQENPAAVFAAIDAQDWAPSELDEGILEQAGRPFDLERGPALRACLYRRREGARLLLAAHHIAVDLWSLMVMLDDLVVLYGQATFETLPKLAVRYADYVREQRRLVDSLEGEQHWTYWKAQLAGAPAALKLPVDRPRPPVPSLDGGVYEVSLDSSLVTVLKELARQEGSTLYNVLLGAFQALLFRYSGEEDIRVGTPTSGRTSSGYEALVGYFINSVVIRSLVAPQQSFREFLKQLRETVIGALDHQSYPFSALLERLGNQRRAALCDVWFSWDRPQRAARWASSFVSGQGKDSAASLSPLPMELVALRQLGAPYDLTLIVFEEDDSLRISWLYSSALFDRSTIERMAKHFQSLLAGVAADPECPIAELPLLTENERRQILVQWNQTASACPSQTFHQSFEEHAERNPNAPAVVFGDLKLSYAELNHRANRVARHLLARGVRIDSLVGLCVEPSIEMVIGMLAILKAGGGFLPLDPQYPPARLAFMMEDARPILVVTQRQTVDRLPADAAQPVFIEDLLAAAAGADEQNPNVEARPDALAYVIYTSGSTGDPKGVLLEHRGLTNVIETQKQMWNVGPEDCVLQSSSLSFDASIFQIVMALGAGARLCVAPTAARFPGLELLEFLEKEGITIVTIPPSVLAATLYRMLPRLRVITVAGEACSKSLVRKWAAGRQFFNLYGPTETTIWATAAECAADGSTPSIGRPIANTSAYVLDRYLTPVPIGTPGELHIGGIGVARGYLNRPELTAQKFIANPFTGSNRSDRLYKTGDLVRYRPDGRLEFLGRIDDQVKIRGFRIEPSEVKVELEQLAGIRSCAVVTEEDSAGETRLVAYVSVDPGVPTSERELKTKLGRRLPEFVVPDRIIVLAQLPLTPNGKIDREQLRPAGLSSVPAQSYSEPESELEQTIASVWVSVLKVERVGRHDNFFDLGGHSILLTRVHARLAEMFPGKVSIVDLLQHPTVSALAAHLNGRSHDGIQTTDLRGRAQQQRLARQRRRERVSASA